MASGQWVSRIPRQQRVAGAHKLYLYEEFRGVITGSATDQPRRLNSWGTPLALMYS